MTAVLNSYLGVGARKAWIFPLNTNGTPAATSTTVYEGMQLVGIQSFSPTFPSPRPITHVGDDIPLAIDYLPTTESASAEITVARLDLDVLAALQSTLVVTQNESKYIGLATDQMGSEPQVGFFTYQQALDGAGARVWRSFLMPRALLSARVQGFAEGGATHTISIAPMNVSTHLWGTAFVPATDGFGAAQILMFITKYRPRIVAWVGDNIVTKFLFPTNAQMADITTPKGTLWIDGVLQSGGTAPTWVADGVTPSAKPGAAARLVALYEQAD